MEDVKSEGKCVSLGGEAYRPFPNKMRREDFIIQQENDKADFFAKRFRNLQKTASSLQHEPRTPPKTAGSFGQEMGGLGATSP